MHFSFFVFDRIYFISKTRGRLSHELDKRGYKRDNRGNVFVKKRGLCYAR